MAIRTYKPGQKVRYRVGKAWREGVYLRPHKIIPFVHWIDKLDGYHGYFQRADIRPAKPVKRKNIAPKKRSSPPTGPMSSPAPTSPEERKSKRRSVGGSATRYGVLGVPEAYPEARVHNTRLPEGVGAGPLVPHVGSGSFHDLSADASIAVQRSTRSVSKDQALTELREWNLRAVPKKTPGRDPAYLDFVRAKPCCVCSAPPPSDPHHIAPRGQKGMGTKVSDYHAAPLCRKCHSTWHARGSINYYDWDGDRVWHRGDFDRVQSALWLEWLESNGSKGRE